MKHCHCHVFLLCFSALTLLAVPALAYEILLDIDTDNDPTTINSFTSQTSALVKVILRPTTQGETIGYVSFGLGGECLDCPPDYGAQTYGTSTDVAGRQPWVTAPGFDSGMYCMMLFGCASNPGFHCVLWFEPTGGGTITLDQPIFLGEFNAYAVHPSLLEGCPQPAHNLMAMPDLREYWNYIQLGVSVNGVEASTWGQVKSIYR